MRRRSVMRVVRLGVPLLTLGCGAGQASATPSSSPPPTASSTAFITPSPTASATATAATPAPVVPTPPPTPAGPPQPCGGKQLQARMTPPSGAAGSAIAQIEIRNDAATACTMNGYPALSATDAHGKAVPLTIGTGTSGSPPGTVMLPAGTALLGGAPRGHGFVYLQWDANCATTTLAQPSLWRLTPPSGAGSTTFASDPSLSGPQHMCRYELFEGPVTATPST